MQSQPAIHKAPPAGKYPWLWDTDMGNDRFDEYLTRADVSSEEAQWAMLRLIEYAPYYALRRKLPKKRFLTMWPQISKKVRAESERGGMEFYHQWLTRNGGGHG